MTPRKQIWNCIFWAGLEGVASNSITWKSEARAWWVQSHPPKQSLSPACAIRPIPKIYLRKKKKTIVFSSNLFPKGGIPCPLCLQWHNSAEPFFSDFFLVSQKPTKRKKKPNPPSYHSFLVSKKMFICNLKVLFATPASVLTTNKLCMVSPEQIPSG